MANSEWRIGMSVERADQLISRFTGLAGGHGLGRGMLSVDAALSEKRDVRNDHSNQTRRSLGAGQHCRRAWSATDSQLRPISSGCAGFAERGGDTSSAFATCRTFDRGRSANAVGAMRGGRKDVAGAHSFVAAKDSRLMNSTIRYSPFAIRAVSEPRQTHG